MSFIQVKKCDDRKTIENLKTLITCQLDLKVMAEMSDLKEAINSQDENGANQTSVAQENPSSSAGKIYVGEYVIGMFTDGFYLEEVLEVDAGGVKIDFLHPVFLKQNDNGVSLWKRPSELQADRHTLETDSILPIIPVLSLSKYSNSRVIIYELINADIVEKFI